jgi:hypothetical protein
LGFWFWRGPIGAAASPPLHPRQRLPRRLLPPVWPGVRADDAAAGAHMRGQNTGTGTSSDQGAASSTASWWHRWKDTSSDRMPFARTLGEVHRFDRIADAGLFHF